MKTLMRSLAAYLSLGIGILVFIIYGLRPDWATALTIFPAWLWLAVWLLALPAFKQKVFVAVSMMWLIFGFFQIEEWRSMARSLLPFEEHENSIRITTVNASGSIVALRDAFAERPDIILVQESPGRQAMERLVEEMGGYEFVYGYDTSIIARGRLEEGQSKLFYISATASIDSQEYFIVSLRLLTSSPRIDLWKLDCWKFQRYMRGRQVEQIKEIFDLLPDDKILVVGGDFNVPQGDRVFTVFSNRMNDTFRGAGRGWCNTILSDIPLLRIDQIWTCGELSSYHAYSRVCPDTDHRLYTAKVKLTEEGG
jgi:hypothetical protein